MRCGNPLCKTESAYFRDGSLHCVDLCSQSPAGENRQVIWLCRDCSVRWTVEGWRPAGEQLRLRRMVQEESRHQRKADLPLSA